MVATGNTLLVPPRRTGDSDTDLPALWEWATDFYQTLAVEANVVGNTATLTEQVADLTKRLKAAEEKLAALGALAALEGPISITYEAQQLADAYNKINAIIYAAR